jgi:hypothetical protein
MNEIAAADKGADSRRLKALVLNASYTTQNVQPSGV